MKNPKNLRYTKEHEWVKVEGNIAVVGITHHAQELLTDVVFVELPEIGLVLEKNANLGVVESVKSVSDIFSPVSGEVTEINEELRDQPELVNQSPFENGWIAKLRIKNAADVDTLMTSEQYDKFITEDG